MKTKWHRPTITFNILKITLHAANRSFRTIITILNSRFLALDTIFIFNEEVGKRYRAGGQSPDLSGVIEVGFGSEVEAILIKA